MKVVGIEPKRYTSKKTQQEVMGFRMYFDKESEHVYGIAVREEWVSDDVYTPMICISEISLWPVPSPARSCFTLSMILHRTTTMAHISGTIPRIWALRLGLLSFTVI